MRSVNTINELLERFILKLEHAQGQTGFGAWLRRQKRKKHQLKPLYVFATAPHRFIR